MKPTRVFISHSSQDKDFARLVVEELRRPDMAPWIDSEQVVAGDDILDQLGHGLQSMDVLVFLVSNASLLSRWVELELKYAVTREIDEKRALVQPFIIDDVPKQDVPWFLAHRNLARVTPDASGAVHIANAIQQAIARRSLTHIEDSPRGSGFKGDPRIDRLIRHIGPGDWDPARDAALEMLKATNEFGQNELFEVLLRYYDCPDEDLRWGAILTIESFAQLAPWLIDHELLTRMANQQDFSIRASAASICLDLARFAADRVPVDVLLKLAVPNEDWYVMAPATAALKSMARSRPVLLHALISRLRSEDPDVREHAARALADIAAKEPEIFEPEDLTRELSRLKRVGDHVAQGHIAEAISKVQQADPESYYKYGL